MKQFLKKNFIIFFISIFFCESNFADSLSTVQEDDFFIGDKDAPITIIEYASLSCSHCANFHIDTLPKLIEEYVDTGKAMIVFRDFPFNYPALLGSMVLRCLPKDIKFEYTEALYKLQSKWVLRENAKTTKELYKIMQIGGMSKEDFNKCIENTELENVIIQGIMDAKNEFEIQSTPTFIINNKKIAGNKSIKEFRQIIDKILSE